MIITKKLVPQIYNTSYDFTLFEAAFDMAFNSVDNRIGSVRGLHSPVNCFEENLQKLASLFNLPEAERNLIKNFKNLIKIKGTRPAIEESLFLCGIDRIVSYKISEHNISEQEKPTQYFTTIEYLVNFSSFKDTLFTFLMEKLAPANCQIKVSLIDRITQ